MLFNKGPNLQAITKPLHLALRHRAIEKVFTDCVMDLGPILILDGIDILPDGFRIMCHDLHGQLPEIMMKDSGDTFRDKNQLAIEVCKIIAMVKLREEMALFMPGGKFLFPTSISGTAIVGFQARPLTWLGEGDDFINVVDHLKT